VNKENLRSKRQALLTELVERKIRLRAEQLFEQRGAGDGSALEDWVKAENEVVGKSALAPLYWRSRSQFLPEAGDSSEGQSSSQG
jgi:hypothetical protein